MLLIALPSVYYFVSDCIVHLVIVSFSKLFLYKSYIETLCCVCRDFESSSLALQPRIKK